MKRITAPRSALSLRSVVVIGASTPRKPISRALAPFNGLALPRNTSNMPESPSTPTSIRPDSKPWATPGVPPICKIVTSDSLMPLLRNAPRKKVSPPEPY